MPPKGNVSWSRISARSRSLAKAAAYGQLERQHADLLCGETALETESAELVDDGVEKSIAQAHDQLVDALGSGIDRQKLVIEIAKSAAAVRKSDDSARAEEIENARRSVERMRTAKELALKSAAAVRVERDDARRQRDHYREQLAAENERTRIMQREKNDAVGRIEKLQSDVHDMVKDILDNHADSSEIGSVATARAAVKALDDRRKALQSRLQQCENGLVAERNEKHKRIGDLKRVGKALNGRQTEIKSQLQQQISNYDALAKKFEDAT